MPSHISETVAKFKLRIGFSPPLLSTTAEQDSIQCFKPWMKAAGLLRRQNRMRRPVGQAPLDQPLPHGDFGDESPE
ncbi:MAG: hypothetical protein OXC53_06040 [Rhodobacteraceae bacterium]|nr:hypothetical protein [Paracoccaceae bacterium]